MLLISWSIDSRQAIPAYSNVGEQDWILPTNIKQVWKGLRETNTLAYYKHLQITEAKSSITLVPGTLSYNTKDKNNSIGSVETPNGAKVSTTHRNII
jgi:hypothetical protein